MIVSEDKITDGIRITEGAYAQDENIDEVIVPEGVEDIGEVAFFGCMNLRSVILPKSLKIIREEAFGESGIEKVFIPEGVKTIAEKAFFSCPNLKYIEIPGENTVIETDAFGDCRKLLEGFVARGYPEKYNPPEELFYTLLWCTCPEKHTAETCEHAERYIRTNEELIMERIFKLNNAAALSGVSKRKLLRQENISRYVTMANENNSTELVALLLAASDNRSGVGEFEL
ncbi:MAG: leucine-rich repeat domain-containing protein [Lachnospiraceae bacterium]|nr:leucine-rich repeat domain-containing protein [Candidatus Darwinimomas equi]